MTELTPLADALVNLKREEFSAVVKEKMDAGADPLTIIHECNEAMVEIGRRFQQNQYFISELIMSSKMLKGAMDMLEPLLAGKEKGPTKGMVVIGTVKDDVHDIGKNLVVTLLRGTGFEVMDLGVDVPKENFVQAVRDTGAKVLGLSALLTMTYPRMKEVVEALEKAGLRDQVKVVIGGAPINEEVRRAVGADYYSRDAGGGVQICNDIYRG